MPLGRFGPEGRSIWRCGPRVERFWMRDLLSRTLRILRSRLPHRRSLKTRLLRLAGGSDRSRWRANESLHRGWDARTRLIGGLVPPGSRVLEFGAGNCALEHALPSGSIHIPSDLIARRADFLVIDLNSESWGPLPNHDVAVFSGVLEYIHDIRGVFLRLARHTPTIIASYAASVSNVREETAERRRRGWVNDLSEQQFIELASSSGYRPVKNSLAFGR